MPFFRSIFQVERDEIGRAEQRLAKRHSVSAASPLRAEIVAEKTVESARVLNISTRGVRVSVADGLVLAAGDRCSVKFVAESMILSLKSKVANISSADGRTELGVEFDENDFDSRQSLIQLLEPIEVGAALKEVDAAGVTQTEPGLVARRFFSARSSSLTLWRNLSTDTLTGFELRVQDFFIRSGAEAPQLKVFRFDGEQALGYSAPTLQQAGEVTEDVKLFFKWFVPHINEDTPVELREFLASYVS